MFVQKVIKVSFVVVLGFAFVLATSCGDEESENSGEESEEANSSDDSDGDDADDDDENNDDEENNDDDEGSQDEEDEQGDDNDDDQEQDEDDNDNNENNSEEDVDDQKNDDQGGDDGLTATIVKAAGPEPGSAPEGHPDAITSETKPDKNTHVFADILADKLAELGVTTTVYHHFDCENLSCAEGGKSDIVVLAAPTHAGSMLSQITSLIPALGNLSPAPSVASGLTSCGNGPGIDKFMQQLEGLGISTIQGVSLQADNDAGGSIVTDDEMNDILSTFANDLVNAL